VSSEIAVVSGYFNPVHLGHLRLFEGAKAIAPYLFVLVNNDKQQMLKKGRIIMHESHRLLLVDALRLVDEAWLASDEDESVCESLKWIRYRYPYARIAFCNGGDRSSEDAVPPAEAEVCEQLGIQMHYGVGGDLKLDSSSRINSLLEG
jgi:glycerol-3-phosphate cytidylyltransferase/D-beta-D-heptose 7-phosphate kinase/D-beta-D-heptose 1-phosphate adenosyltransferase